MRVAGGGRRVALLVALLCAAVPARAQTQAARADQGESGYDLWLRYRPVRDSARLREYRATVGQLFVVDSTPTRRAIADELQRGLSGLLGARVTRGRDLGMSAVGGVTVTIDRTLGVDGYRVERLTSRSGGYVRVRGASEMGALYGAFALLRHLQQERPLSELPISSKPQLALRMLDHWDNLDRSVERGYAGKSLWAWDSLPATHAPRYRDYARANASLGINAVALTNVNANARVLTPAYLDKVAAIASELRPYGIRSFLTARFSAPIEIGGLATADPLDPAVRAWWKAKADEIYARVPDFGGFLVKANSEGQPGPQQYGRTHADGANMLADAVASHGGVVIWRAFVYSNEVPTDRVKQAYDEFHPLDGKFRENVFVQVKNGPLDFQPREPVHPLFGAMPKTPLMLELQVTKEYLGQDTHLAWLGPLFEETLRWDTEANGKGTTVARVLERYPRTGIAGVANVGTDTNWTGSQFNQANWYVFGRMAWDPSLSPRAVAEEWARLTWGNDPAVVRTVVDLMTTSREAVVNYMTPLGLAHIMATGHHYGPGAWVSNAGRPDWSPTYYHRADTLGIGFDRTATGSDAVAQYAPSVRDRLASRATVPDSMLLWFHRVRWTEKLSTGRTLWDELVTRYDAGVDSVHAMRRAWGTLRGRVDARRFAEVDEHLSIQEREAQWWRDASLAYFATFARQPFPAGHAPPPRSLDYYRSLRCPANRDKPRCDEIP